MQNTRSFPLSFEPFASSGQAKESLAKKSRPLPYNCLKIARNGCKNLTPRPTEEHCRASSNRNSCPSASHSLLLNNRCRAGYAIAHNFLNGNYTKACLPSCMSISGSKWAGRRVVFPNRKKPNAPTKFRYNFRCGKPFWTAMMI